MLILICKVGVRRLELPTSTSRTWRAANCATPRIGDCKDRYFFYIRQYLPESFFREITVKFRIFVFPLLYNYENATP